MLFHVYTVTKQLLLQIRMYQYFGNKCITQKCGDIIVAVI